MIGYFAEIAAGSDKARDTSQVGLIILNGILRILIRILTMIWMIRY